MRLSALKHVVVTNTCRQAVCQPEGIDQQAGEESDRTLLYVLLIIPEVGPSVVLQAIETDKKHTLG